ncbi:MAG: glycosyltransferase family 39 protein [Pseudomonadota bacterium]
MTAAATERGLPGRIVRWSVAAVNYIEAHPGRSFLIFALLHAAIWTLLPSVLFHNLPLDVIEGLIYGREWPLGNEKLPPLPWWLIETVHRLWRADVAQYLLSQIVVVSAFAIVFFLARELTGAVAALGAILIIDGLNYFGSTATQFNHNVVELPFWALAGASYFRALRTGRLIHWILLGVALGLGFWAKYFVITLAVPLILFLLLDRDARRALATPGPYITAAVGLAVVAPHLWWLIQNDFAPLNYIEHRSLPPSGIGERLWRPVEFLLVQATWLLPSLLIAASLFYPRTPRGPIVSDAFGRKIILLLAFGPALTLLAISLVTGRPTKAQWGYPLWLYLGLVIVIYARPVTDRIRWARMGWMWAIVTATYAAAMVMDYQVVPRVRGAYRAALFPGPEIAEKVSDGFRKATGEPVAYVISDMFTAGSISTYAPNRPRAIIEGQLARTPWVDADDLRRKGAVVVWVYGDAMPAAFGALAGSAVMQQPFTLPMFRGPRTLKVGWAIVMPQR